MENKAKLGITIAVIFGVYFYFTPYLAANSMKKAAEAKDTITLSSHINFPSLKESLKANFNAMVASEVVKSKNVNPFEAIGAALATVLINPMIDALVTPESLAMMMKGDKPVIDKGSPEKEKASSTNQDTDVHMGYESFDRFVVSVKKKGATEEPTAFVFYREGLLSWKLSALRLPNPRTETQ